MPLSVLPDAELLAVGYLRGQAEVAAIVGTRVYTELPAAPVFPLLTLHRFGGVPTVPRRLDAARVQVEAWAETKFAARALAATAQAALFEMVGTFASGVVTGVSYDLGLTWSPDTDVEPPRPRYIFGVIVHAHP